MMSVSSSDDVSRGSHVQYAPHDLRPQSGPLIMTIAAKTNATSAPLTASASR